jgi:hypothetical protein
MDGRDYFDKYGDTLPVTCKPIAITATPAEQTMQLPIEVPPYQGGGGGGGGSGSGRGSGSGSGGSGS